MSISRQREDVLEFSGGDTNLYGYVMNDPVNYRDSLGLSSLTYNSGTGTLTLYDGSGNVVGQYPAGNNTITNSNGPWPTGTYDYSYHTDHHYGATMRILIPILSIVAMCWNASAHERYCTKAEATKAEYSASKLNNWENIYKSFETFRHCDDGAIAEGYSDSIARMLADRWNRLETLIKLTSSNKDFCTFVLRHIDATADKFEIEKIINNSSKHCPESAKAMCSAIGDAARKALREFME